MERFLQTNPSKEKQQMGKAPTVQVQDDDESEAREFGPDDIKRLVVEAIQENPSIDMADLRQVIAEELAKIDMDPGLLQEAVMKQLNMAIHGQANNFAERVVEHVESRAQSKYDEWQAAQKWSTGKKIAVGAGVCVAGGCLYAFGHYRGHKVGGLENG